MSKINFLIKEEHEKERLSVCKSCEKYKLGFCMACGCAVKLKVKLKNAVCPLQKWDSVEESEEIK
jgi:hypothetical protein